MNLVLAVLGLLLSYPENPECVLPALYDSILSDNPGFCSGMISELALEEIDSVLANHPGQIERMLSYFGINMEIDGLEDIDGEELIEIVLSSPGFKDYLLLFGVTPGDPLFHEGGTFVPVTWGILGNMNTVFVQLVEEDGTWKVRDLFEDLPARIPAGGAGRGI